MSEITPITREEKLWNGEDLEPLTREEMYIKRIFDKTQTIPDKPLTRKEILMEKAGEGGGGDVTIKQLSVTANGTYSEEGTAYSPVNVNVPMPENAYLLKTASGSLVSFSDGADLPIPSFVCDIDAVQDLHGYDAPWDGGSGKNKLPMIVDDIKAANITGTWSGNSFTRSGVTYTILTDSGDNVVGISVSGTATYNSDLYIPVTLADGVQYVLNGGVNGGSDNTYKLQVVYGSSYNNLAACYNTNDTAFTYTSDLGNTYMRIRVYNGTTVSNLVFKPMIRLATETDATFAPYSNICPISGHTGVNAWVRGKNLLSINSLSLNRDTQRVISSNINPIPKGTYTISWAYSGTSQNTSFILRKSQNDQTDQKQFTVTDGTQSTFTIDETYSAIYAFIGTNQESGTTAEISNLMIRPSTDTDPTYEPYNPNSQTIQVNWQTEAGEVYGGEIDLVSGVLTVVGKYKLFDGSEKWTITSNVYLELSDMKSGARQDGLCNYFPVRKSEASGDNLKIQFGANGSGVNSLFIINAISSGYDTLEKVQALTTGMQIVYPLAEAQTYQLTPTQIKSLLGNNNAWCSTGDIDIDYFAKEV